MNTFDIAVFLKAWLNTVGAILPLVLGLVTYFGRLGVKGRGQLVASLTSGLVLGGATMYFQTAPVSAAEWFGIFVVGLITGLTATGVYDTGKEIVSKVSVKTITAAGVAEAVAKVNAAEQMGNAPQ